MNNTIACLNCGATKNLSSLFHRDKDTEEGNIIGLVYVCPKCSSLISGKHMQVNIKQLKSK